MKSPFSQWLEEKAPKMLYSSGLNFFTLFSWETIIHMGTAMTNSIPATFGHWGLFLLVACFHWEKGSRKKNRTPFSISPTVSESPDQGPSKNTGVCPKKIGSRGNCPSFVGGISAAGEACEGRLHGFCLMHYSRSTKTLNTWVCQHRLELLRAGNIRCFPRTPKNPKFVFLFISYGRFEPWKVSGWIGTTFFMQIHTFGSQFHHSGTQITRISSSNANI